VTCPNCGTANLDNATLCIQCGRPLNAAATPPPPPRPVQQTYTPPPPPPSSFTEQASYTPPPPGGQPQVPGRGPALFYLIASIPLICCCDPLMIVSLIFAVNAMSRRSAGDFAGMASNTRLAAIWFWISLVIGVVAWGLLIGVGGWDVFEEIRNNLPR
jgi:hypothetical protein